MTDHTTLTDQAADDLHRDAATLVWLLDTGDLTAAAALLSSMSAGERASVALILAAACTTAATDRDAFAAWLATHSEARP